MKAFLARAPAVALRLALGLAGGVSLAALAASASCYRRVDDDDDLCDDDFDDDDLGGCDDDDTVVIVFGSSSEGYRLESFRMEQSGDPDLHPVARLSDLEAPTIFELLGPGTYDALAFRALSDRFLEVNDDLLGLPARAGRRAFDGVRFERERIVVSYAQEALRDGAWARVPGAGTELAYDRAGRLVEVANRVRLAPDLDGAR